MQNEKFRMIIKNLKRISIMVRFFVLLVVFLVLATKPAKAAKFYFDPGQEQPTENSSFNADIWLDTEGVKTTGVDVVLEFDASKITIETVSFSDIYPKSTVRKKDNTNGRLEASAYFTDLFSVYQGKNRLATVRFKVGTEYTNVNFICQGGETADTNILEIGGGDVVNCGSLGILQVTISAGASPSPAASPSPSPSPGVGGPDQPADSDGCEMDSPDRPSGLTATSGPGRGQVSLHWNKVGGATHYAIAYGERWLDFDYGAANVGDTDTFVVSGLKANVPYYFVVTAVNGCASSGYSDGAAAYAGWGAAAYQPSQEKGWEPPKPIEFKEDEDEATEGAEFEPSPMPSPSPVVYEPPKPHKPWERATFWRDLGIAGLILFLLWLLLGFWRRRKKSKRMMKEMETEISERREEPPTATGQTESPTPPPFSNENLREKTPPSLPPSSPPPPF